MREFRTSTDWDRAFYAPRHDAPLCATAIVSRGNVALIVPIAGKDDDVALLLTRLADRVRRPVLPHGGKGERR